MPTEQEWRDKYRDVLSRLAAEEARWSKSQNVLKLLVGRLCLAAQGRDERLDHEIARVADVARRQIDVDALDLLIAPLSAAVAALDSMEGGGSGVRRGPKADSSTASMRIDSTGSVPAGARDGAGGTAAGGAGTSSVAASATGARDGTSGTAAGGTGTSGGAAGANGARDGVSGMEGGGAGTSGVAAGATGTHATAPASGSATGAATGTHAASTGAASSVPMPAGSAATLSAASHAAASPGATTSAAPFAGAPETGARQSSVTTPNGAPHATSEEAFGATAVLDRLSLLPELKPVVGELRSRKNDHLGIHELADLLERVTRFATEQRAQVQKEKLELQNIVQQLASRLEEISQHISGEMADRNAGQEDCEQLNVRVTNEVTQLRLTAESASDITTLKNQLSSRLDAISSHLTDFKLREESRVRTYRDRVTRMRTRIAVLERESRSLTESLREEQRMAMIDSLTGIPNRAAYDDRIEQEHKRWKRFARPVSILAWDIDRFKAINDAYGHKAGDKVLRVIGQHLARHVRDTDFVGRYGGEEFVMLLVGTEPDEARAVAEKIRLEISQLGFHFHDRPVSITASCGITSFQGDDTTDGAFDRADKALYQAKEGGRNCCIVA